MNLRPFYMDLCSYRSISIKMFQSALGSNSLSHTSLLYVNLSHMVSKIFAVSVLLLFDLKIIFYTHVFRCVHGLLAYRI